MKRIKRYARLRIITATPEKLLTDMMQAGIVLMDVVITDLLTIEMTLCQQQYLKFQKFASHNEIEYILTNRDGFCWKLQNGFRRPLLLIGLAVFAILAFMIPERIFCVSVSGNVKLSTRQIKTAAEECGIGFGTKRYKVRSEQMKNQLLTKLPELQWVGITTMGSEARIAVKERSEPVKETESPYLVSGIVAKCDGVISKIDITHGTALVSVGQYVKAGDLLVSGYTDCGLKIKAGRAEGEIYAFTSKEKRFTVLKPVLRNMETKERETDYRLSIGKKVINLYNHSGICPATCAKMYMEEFWTLPGGFQLPVSMIQVDTDCYHIERQYVNTDEIRSWLCDYAHEFVLKEMVAGKILKEEYQWGMDGSTPVLIGEFSCHEMIGEEKHEEIIE